MKNTRERQVGKKENSSLCLKGNIIAVMCMPLHTVEWMKQMGNDNESLLI